MLTTEQLFRTVISQRKWYEGSGLDRFQAGKVKQYFNQGKVSEEKQTEILLKLGYSIKTPKLWNEQPSTGHTSCQKPEV